MLDPHNGVRRFVQQCKTYRFHKRLHTVSISGCIKRLHIVLGNLTKLLKAVIYRFHKWLPKAAAYCVR
jgi:hypothetical protein